MCNCGQIVETLWAGRQSARSSLDHLRATTISTDWQILSFPPLIPGHWATMWPNCELGQFIHHWVFRIGLRTERE